MLFITLSLLLWLLALFMALEVGVRTMVHRRSDKTEAYIEKVLAAGRTADSEYLAHIQSQSDREIPEPPPAREDFASLSENARLELAASRSEIIIKCDRKGTILSQYAPPEASLSQAMQDAAALLKKKTVVFDILSPEQTSDALRAIQQEMPEKGFFFREYALGLNAGEPEALFEFTFLDLPQQSGGYNEFTVWIRESFWEDQGRKFRPNVLRFGLFNAHVFFTNSQGFRDYEVCLPKPKGVYRIVCVGGSTTFEGPHVDLTYPKMLQRKLRDHFNTDSIEVINCGVLSISSDGERERAADYLALEPDLLVHYNFVNDLYSRLYGSMYSRFPVFTPIRWLKWQMRHSEFLFQHAPRLYLPPDSVWIRELQNTTINNMRVLGREAEKQSVSVAFCSFAYPDTKNMSRAERDFFDKRIQLSLGDARLNADQYGRYAQMYATEVQRLCSEEGWLYIPVAENIQAGTVYFSDICHMFCAGMDRKAEAVFQEIREVVASGLGL